MKKLSNHAKITISWVILSGSALTAFIIARNYYYDNRHKAMRARVDLTRRIEQELSKQK